MSRFLVRGASPLRDLPLIGWLLVAAGVALSHRWLPNANWLMLHLVLLGALTHAVMVWSHHFAQTLLRVPDAPADHRAQQLRLGLLAAGTAAVLVGVSTTWWPLTLAGAIIVATAVGWHGLVLWRMLRRALPARFKVTVHYYLAAASALVVGIAFGVTAAWGWDDSLAGRLLVAHAFTNLLGWIGLTVTGTLLTLWPTMLRTRMDPRAERWTRQALPVLVGGVTVAVAGALLGWQWVSALGLVGYLAGLALWGRGLWQPARTRPPREFAPASVAASLGWFVIGIGWAGWLLVTAADWANIRDAFVLPAAVLAAGCGVQLVTGALSYLMPVVIGRGPAGTKAAQAWLNRAGGFRLIAINGGLVLWLAPTPSWVKVVGSLLALGAALAFLPLLLGGRRAAKRARADADTPVPTAPAASDQRAATSTPAAQPSGLLSAGQLIAGLTALVSVVVIGVGVDPAAAGSGAAASVGGQAMAVPTGQVVRVQVQAVGMKFVPAQVHLARGDRLVVELVNADTTTHDLVIGAARTGRIAPGATAELDAGVISESIEGFCSVVGHRQLGMVFQVIADGAAVTAPTATAAPSGHPAHSDQPASPVSGVIDPVLAPLTDERVHRLTMTVAEVNLEVAPGVWQRRWTYNGTAPGPTLHGRVGDSFEITLINDGSIGHSIDFHAGSLAPDQPMRTIEPGQSLVYRFTAKMAGIWMYHCSTMPMSSHISAGMFGAVVIEPDGLPAVDRSYLLVQSEVYLAPDATGPAEVDAAKVSAEQPDYVTFNGVARGYDQQPLTARAGERVRFWVLDAGPNRPSSFHIVGTQFDTVYAEGHYQLNRGRDGFGSSAGGSQVLGLQPAQGGFVEAVFPEPGHYPVVSHLMVDAERGAHGIVAVTEGVSRKSTTKAR